MSQPSNGNTVKVHYTGTLGDGTVFDSSVGREPLEFTVGAGGIIPGFEQAVLGMEVGDSREVNIPAAEAYGERREEMVLVVPREQMPDDVEMEVGLQLQAQGPQGELLQFVVAAYDDQSVTVDANHPLAGKDLTFVIELLEVA